MKVTLDIPDELVPIVIRILEEQHFPDDDGGTDCWIMRDLDINVDQFVKALHIVDGIVGEIKKQGTS